DDVVGTYECKYQFGVERLELRKDGTYVQVATLQGRSSPIVNRGSWTIDGSKLDLEDPVLVDDNFGGLSAKPDEVQRGLWTEHVATGGSSVELAWSPDSDLKFSKISTSKQ